MGIQGLLGALKSSMQTTHIRNLRGLTVGVDVLCWLHKGIYTCATELALYGVQSEICRGKFLEFCLQRIKLLQAYDITPYMVFDGAQLPTKEGTETSRKEKRDAAYYAGLDYHRAGESSLAHAQFVKSVDIDPYLCYLLIEELRKLGIQFVVAPYEADAQLAYLCRTGVVDAVITEDSDLIAYGCPRVLFKLDKNGDAREWRRRWLGSTAESFKAGATSVKDTAMLQNESTVQLERLHQYDDDLLVLMCVLAGCDYCPSLPGVGIKKANGIINTYKKNWRLMLKQLPLRMKIPVDKVYTKRFERALLTFRHQRVFDPKRRKLVCLNPLPRKLLPKEIDPDNLPSDSMCWHGYGWPENSENLDFLGPLLKEETSCSIADGLIDPFSLKPFEAFVPAGAQVSELVASSTSSSKPSETANTVEVSASSESSLKQQKLSAASWSSRKTKRKRDQFMTSQTSKISDFTPPVKATKGRPELDKTISAFAAAKAKSSYFAASSSNKNPKDGKSTDDCASNYKAQDSSLYSDCSNPRRSSDFENVSSDFTPFYKRLSSSADTSRVKIDFDKIIRDSKKREESKHHRKNAFDKPSFEGPDENKSPFKQGVNNFDYLQDESPVSDHHTSMLPANASSLKQNLFDSFSYKASPEHKSNRFLQSRLNNAPKAEANLKGRSATSVASEGVMGFRATKPTFGNLF